MSIHKTVKEEAERLGVNVEIVTCGVFDKYKAYRAYYEKPNGKTVGEVAVNDTANQGRKTVRLLAEKHNLAEYDGRGRLIPK